jgi:hypothetical protein
MNKRALNTQQRKFANLIAEDIIELVNETPTQQLTVTTFDRELVTATKQRIVKHIRNVYGITQN